MTIKIGLTGGIGSGKTTVADLFSELGTPIIDADQIARELTETNPAILNAMINHFGSSIMSENQLDRSTLRRRIFDDPEERQWLENLLHPLIFETFKERVSVLNSHYCLLVIPLLAESNAIHLVDRVLVVDCPEDLQIKRVMARNQLSEREAQSILDAQISRNERLSIADDLIYNAGETSSLELRVADLHTQYLKLSKKSKP